MRFPVFSRNDEDYDLLIYLANWPIKRIDAWDTLLKARSIENQCYTIGVNRVGEDGNKVPFNGHSKVVDASGKEVLSSTENKEEVLQIEISLDDLKLKRRQLISYEIETILSYSKFQSNSKSQLERIIISVG